MRVFEEKQRFNQWWLQLINLALFGFLGFAVYNWYILGEDMGNVAAEDTTAQLVVIFLFLVSISITYIFKLHTLIDEKGIHYKFYPLHRTQRVILWKDIRRCYTRKYMPLSEYGGWGYKFGLGKGRALNVKGNHGIQIEFKNEKKLLLGTQNPENAQLVIDRYFKK